MATIGNFNFPQPPVAQAQGFAGQPDLSSLQNALFQLASMLQQPSSDYYARYQAQEAQAAQRVQVYSSYLNDAMARMNAENAQIQATFQSSMGLTGVESAFSGFLNQTFQPISYQMPNYGSYGYGYGNAGYAAPAVQPQAPPPTLFGGPIEVPTFYAQRTSFRRW